MNITVRVTQEHIDKARALKAKGRRAPCYICPVAQSLISEGYGNVSVGRETAAWVTPDGQWVEVPLPGEAEAWITAYDCDLDVNPFEFELVERD